MIQPLPVSPSATQLELIDPPPKLPPPTLIEEMIPMKIQHQCVELLGDMLATLVAATEKGNQDER
jgi:hypothetical protein